MSKRKLPKNWIVLNSKTRPDRVYYFNTKTNKSSWEEPSEDQSQQPNKGLVTPPKKRSRSTRQDDVPEFEPSTPEYKMHQENIITERKKLIAKRSLKQQTEKVTEKKDTPQMQVLREKIQKKKNKNNASKSVKHSEDTEVSSVSNANEAVPLIPIVESQANPREGCTPQMLAILEKMKEKGTKSVNKVKNVEESKGKSPKLARQRRQEDKDSTDRNSTKEKLDDGNSLESTPVKGNQNSIEKKFRKKRKKKSKSSSSQTSGNESINQESSFGLPKLDKLPPVHKNAEVRLVRLKDRLLKSKMSINKNLHIDEGIEQQKSVTTVGQLVKRSNKDSFYEEMDWEPMEDERITFEVQAVRIQLCAESNIDTLRNVPINVLSYPPVLAQQEKRQLYIVVDTNVFLSNIEAIKLAAEATFKTYDKPIIVIPWTVIRELDYIKDNNNKKKSAALSYKARQAVNYINNLFSSKHPRVVGQTPEDVVKNKEKFATDCPDDEILQLCLQICELGMSVVLMSYDKNLCNKAMIYDVETLGRNDPLEKVDYLNAVNSSGELSRSFEGQAKKRLSMEPIPLAYSDSRFIHELFEDIKAVIRDMLTVIVSREMHELYGDCWERYVIIKPPWTVITVLKCAIKHWIAAVSASFSHKADSLLKILLEMLGNTSDKKTFIDVTSLLDKSSDLTQMVNTQKHRDLTIQISNKLDELKKKCCNYQHEINERKLNAAIGAEPSITEQEQRAQKAFQYFEAAYVFARDMCGMAAEIVGMPCSFHYSFPNPAPAPNYVKQTQPELAANVNKLLHTLSAVLEQVNTCIDSRTLTNLQQSLITFLPESVPLAYKLSSIDLAPLDVYCCVKLKEEVMKTGLRQLQDLSTHFCRLASYRCT